LWWASAGIRKDETECIRVVERRCLQVNTRMNSTLSVQIDAETKKRLDALSRQTNRSKSFLAAEAIAAHVESEELQLGELQAGIQDLESGQVVRHEKAAKWLKSWGRPGETKAPAARL
jgi:RHH-type rel operon transcriptional repressor/antitoxin RelB